MRGRTRFSLLSQPPGRRGKLVSASGQVRAALPGVPERSAGAGLPRAEVQPDAAAMALSEAVRAQHQPGVLQLHPPGAESTGRRGRCCRRGIGLLSDASTVRD